MGKLSMSNSEQMNELALFAGAGGGILGGHLLGWRTVCAVEWEAYPASVLVARQNDKILPPFPIWDDVQTFDGKPWRGIVDVVSGGFPCQDISVTGKGDGLDGERSGMWREMARIIGEVRPKYAFVENSPMLTTRGLGTVLADLSSMGFDAKWGVVSAADVGANHQRERIWIRAEQRNFFSHTQHDRNGWGKQQPESAQEKAFADTGCKPKRPNKRLRSKRKITIGSNITKLCGEMANASDTGLQRSKQFQNNNRENISGQTKSHGSIAKRNNDGRTNGNWWDAEPELGRVAHGVAARVHRLKAIGNGQVPLCAAIAWELLK